MRSPSRHEILFDLFLGVAGILTLAAAVIGLLVYAAFAPAAHAHDLWANGEPVPAWVKKACCGPDDAHHLRSDDVQYTSEGWRVKGYNRLIPKGGELYSPDGTYWVFYRTFDDGSQTSVYCFFVPFPGT